MFHGKFSRVVSLLLPATAFSLGCTNVGVEAAEPEHTLTMGGEGQSLGTPITGPTGRVYCDTYLSVKRDVTVTPTGPSIVNPPPPPPPPRGCVYRNDAHAQAETSSSIQSFNSQTIATVAFNDDYGIDNGVQYTPDNRRVYPGASMLGWAYSVSTTTPAAFPTWVRGHISKPPPGVAVLWGDPGMTASRANQNHVFMSNLMVPTSKFPPVGYIEGYINQYIGGVCIARSNDAGKTFGVSAADCLTYNNDFYDGGSMVSDNNGAIFVGVVDADRDRVDIWQAPTDTAPFARMTEPFPNIAAATHPRLRFDAATGSIYVMVTDKGGTLWLNRWSRGSWGTPLNAASGVAVYPLVQLSDRSIRTGPQFSFDVGTPSGGTSWTATPGGHNDEIRLCASFYKPGGAHIGIQCGYIDRAMTISPANAFAAKSTMSLPGDQFNPAVSSFPGFGTILPAAWKASWTTNEQDPAGNTVQVIQTALTADAWWTNFIIGPQSPCPDLRGYWGDYDDLQVAGVGANGSTTFIRFFPDSSSSSCTQKWEFYGAPLHVSEVTFQ